MIDSFSQNSQHRRCCLPVSAHSPHFRHPPRTTLSDYKRNVSSDFAIRPEGLQIYLRLDPRHRYATFMPKSPHANWFAAQLKPNGLKRAEENLTRQGFETFCPKRLEGRLQGGQYRPRERPLFPGYLFVSLNQALRTGPQSMRREACLGCCLAIYAPQPLANPFHSRPHDALRQPGRNRRAP